MIAYLDMPSGISGDMFLGCLVDAGWPIADLQSVIALMGLPDGSWSVGHEVVQRGPLRGSLVDVQVEEGPTHRHLSDVAEIIEASKLSDSVKDGSIRVFTRLAKAESWVHGTSIEEVHFHEVGALDAIVDIVGTVAGLEALGIRTLYASGAPLGEGWTNSAHGKIPLPAPATLHILTEVNAPNRWAPGPGELVTPTGAALVAELAEFRQPLMTLERTGYGAGQKNFDWPNLARLWLGKPRPASARNEKGSQTSVEQSGHEHQAHAAAQQDEAAATVSATISGSVPEGTIPEATIPEAADETRQPQPANCVVLETNIDDMNPEVYAAARERLSKAGALDVWTTPIQMKKERPGVLLSVLAPADLEEQIAHILLTETTTLGLRSHTVHRHMADRRFEQVETKYGTVSIKMKYVKGEFVGLKPEYADCLALAEAANVPLQTVQESATFEAYRVLRG